MFSIFLSFVAGQMLYLLLHLETSSFPKPLSPGEEARAFAAMAAGDAAAREELIRRNLRLVAHVAKKYYPGRQDTDDLISIGTIGLIKAVDSFSADKGARFSTYAARCVENELLMSFRGARRERGTVYISDPIDSDRDGNALTRGDILADDARVEDAIENEEERRALHALIARTLDGRERQILLLRYGLSGGQPMTQQQVADILGISRSYISRLEKRAVEALRDALKAEE